MVYTFWRTNMDNISTDKPNDQNKKSLTQEFDLACADLIKEEDFLLSRMEQLGYKCSIEKFLEVIPPIDDDPEIASQILELQQIGRNLLLHGKKLEATICIEPAKLHEAVNAVEDLLIRHREKNIYQRAGKLVRVANVSFIPQEKSAPIKRRARDTAIIKEIDQVHLTLLLTELGNFVRLGTKDDTRKIDCPEKIARCLLAKQEWKLPILVGIINTPTLREDGSILDNPGYDENSGMLFIPGDCDFEKIPEYPTYEDALVAKDLLLNLIKDFPFEDEVSKSVSITAILTALIRKSIPTAPLFGFTAPKMASGKSLLADVAALITTGKPNSVIAQADSEAEEKKRIMAILMEGDPIVCYDNVERPFGSASLCAILTQREYKDRLLGGNETRTVLTNATFLATGNNLTFMGDISTRTLLCKIDPQVERPEERSFRENLYLHIPTHRAALVRAALIILRAYHVAGLPKIDVSPFGRFEAWSNWVRSAVIWIGLADPCESRKEIEDADPIRNTLEILFSSWYEIFNEQSIKVKELACHALTSMDETSKELKDVLCELAPDRKEEINSRILAKKFASFKNRIENGFRLEQMEKNQGTFLWRVRKINK
jgi:hypothetical protein